MMNHEYVVPMTDQTRGINLYPSSTYDGGVNIPSFSLSTSLKPQMHFSTPCFVKNYEIEGDDAVEMTNTNSPEIPLDILKKVTVEMLTAGVCAVRQDVRDPVGGNMEFLLVPLIKLFYALLVMGVFSEVDLLKVLTLIEPGVFSPNPETPVEEEKEDTGGDEKECKGGHQKEDDSPKQGLLQMKLPEAVKLEVTETADFLIMRYLYIMFKINNLGRFLFIFNSPALPCAVLPV